MKYVSIWWIISSMCNLHMYVISYQKWLWTAFHFRINQWFWKGVPFSNCCCPLLPSHRRPSIAESGGKLFTRPWWVAKRSEFKQHLIYTPLKLTVPPWKMGRAPKENLSSTGALLLLVSGSVPWKSLAGRLKLSFWRRLVTKWSLFLGGM